VSTDVVVGVGDSGMVRHCWVEELGGVCVAEEGREGTREVRVSS
jgi:hypothetical protein